jgi:hypothetical protein
MYCPKCSQPQVSEEVRFCSRCGFSLSAVRELVAGSGGDTLVERGAEAQPGQLSRGRRGVRKGARMMLASLVLGLIVAVFASIDDVFAVLILLPLLCFVVGFGRVLYGVFLADKRARRAKEAITHASGISLTTAQIGGDTRRHELFGPWATAPVGSFTAQQGETSKMVQPPSVAEGTTRLFQEGEPDPLRK